MYVEINPSLAGNIGVKDGEMVWVESNQGKVRVKAKITNASMKRQSSCPITGQVYLKEKTMRADILKGLLNMHFGDSCNIVTAPGYDEITAMQETKVGLCKVYKAQGG